MDFKEMWGRIDSLVSRNISKDQIAKKLNAEFEACFYVAQSTLMVLYKENGKQEWRSLG